MDKGHEIGFSDEQENTNRVRENKNENLDLMGITTKEIININKKYLNDLEPPFKNSIKDFVKVLNDHLNDVQISIDQKKLLEKQIEGIVKEIKNIPIYKKIPNNVFTDSKKSIHGNNNEAIACYDKALEIDPMNADAYNNKDLSQYYLGYNDEV